MQKKPVIVGIGEILFDLLPEGPRPGGAVCNFVTHAAAQGCEGVIVSAVGTDDPGKELIRFFHARGVVTDYIQQRRLWPTGMVRVTLADGIPSYTIVSPAAWDHLQFGKALRLLAQRTDAVTWGTLGQRNEESQKTICDFLSATRTDAIRFFDVNLRQNFYSGETIQHSLDAATHLKIADSELPVLAQLLSLPDRVEPFVEALMDKEPTLQAVLLTLGKAGSLYFPRSGEVIRTAVFECGPCVDTVGCGDSFGGAFVAALCLGCSTEEALTHAAKVAGFVAASAGALPQMPREYRLSCASGKTCAAALGDSKKA
ncbi:MAG: PfkB family carbohydrate kinase [Victivallaceae bacterium]|nr:PfkB family carbohydrate kinase [Victivallaceae bacterium]